MAPRVVFDTNTLWNFASVDRLDLLEERFEGRAVWTEAVRTEIENHSSSEPYLRDVLNAKWLGEPVQFTLSEYNDIFQIRTSLAGTHQSAAKHLGEAECIYLIEKLESEMLLATDDAEAADLATRRRLRVIRTADILSECHSMYEIGCPDAFDLLIEMESVGRHLYVPDDHTSVC